MGIPRFTVGCPSSLSHNWPVHHSPQTSRRVIPTAARDTADRAAPVSAELLPLRAGALGVAVAEQTWKAQARDGTRNVERHVSEDA